MTLRALRLLAAVILSSSALAGVSTAAEMAGVVKDETGGALPGVSIELRRGADPPQLTATDTQGRYRFDGVEPGPAQVTFALVNFAGARRDVSVPASGTVRVDAVMQLSLSADVTVTGMRTFTNLADVENPAENLVGIAMSASQGAITARQLERKGFPTSITE